MNFLQQLFEQLRQVWLGTSVAGRFGFVVLSAACLAVVMGVGYWASQPDYRVLFSGMSPEDAGAVTAKLQAQGVPFRLSAGGTSISVPAARVQQARVDLAVAGLPAGGAKGYELLDDSPLGVTPFMQHVNYGRAIQAELAKTIMQLESVEFARVHIVRPEPTPFVRDQKPTTASVVLKLRAGTALNRGTATGIVALVAGSVEGLEPDAVTILDTTGRVLSEPRGGEAGAAASSQLEHRREMELYLASKAEEMLAQLLGPGRSVVRVTAEINFNRLREKKENIDPDSRVVSRERTSQKKSTTSSTARGPAGAASNSARPATDPGSSGVGMNEEESESDYVFSKTIMDLDQPGGAIERLTVAAMVDLSQEASESGEAAAAAITIAEVEEIIKRAVGFKPNRDEIKVTSVKLAGVPALGSEGDWLAAQRWQSYEKIARHASLAVAALVALFLGRIVLKRLLPAVTPAAAAAEPVPDKDRLIGELAAVAEHNPEAIARVLDAWLNESKPGRRAAA